LFFIAAVLIPFGLAGGINREKVSRPCTVREDFSKAVYIQRQPLREEESPFAMLRTSTHLTVFCSEKQRGYNTPDFSDNRMMI